jgi:hypothetical protein
MLTRRAAPRAHTPRTTLSRGEGGGMMRTRHSAAIVQVEPMCPDWPVEKPLHKSPREVPFDSHRACSGPSGVSSALPERSNHPESSSKTQHELATPRAFLPACHCSGGLAGPARGRGGVQWRSHLAHQPLATRQHTVRRYIPEKKTVIGQLPLWYSP